MMYFDLTKFKNAYLLRGYIYKKLNTYLFSSANEVGG